MTRIAIRIRSLTVHGNGHFAGEAFSAALTAELQRRIGAGEGTAQIVDRFRGERVAARTAPTGAPARGTLVEATSAVRVAGRLLP
jgi:hypothetical protein